MIALACSVVFLLLLSSLYISLCLHLTLHRFVATGQQKATGPDEVPYVCIWDVDTCNLMQRLDHDKNERA